MDEHIGIDYSLLQDPSVSTDTLDLDFKVKAGSCPADPPSAHRSSCASLQAGHDRVGGGWATLQRQKRLLSVSQGMFFPRMREAQELEHHAVEPVIKETERMVYVAFSEYFFDSAMQAYFQAGVLAMRLQGEKVTWCSTARWHGQGPAARRQGGCCHPGSSSAGSNGNSLLTLQWFVLLAGTQGPGSFAESYLLWDHLHAGERSMQPGQGGQGTALPGSVAHFSSALRRAPPWTLPCSCCSRCRLRHAAPSNPRAPLSPSLPSSTSLWCHQATLPCSSPVWSW